MASRLRLRLILILALALLAKLAALLTLGSHPLLQADAGLDTGAYVRLASRVAAGDLLLGKEPYFVSPLYIYVLAPILKLTGGSLFAARLVQILLGTAAAGLVFGTARRLFGEGAAVVAAVLYVLVGVVTFHEILILQAALDPFLTAFFLFLLSVGLTSGSLSSKVNKEKARFGGSLSWGIWLATGAAGGFLALNRPNALLALAAVAIALAAPPLVARLRGGQRLFPPLEESSLRTIRPAAMFTFGVVLAIAPVALRNLFVSHEVVLISSHGGLNFFIGNSAEADGTYHAVPGITPSIEGQAEDTKRVAEAEAGRPLSVREVSSHFSRKAWRWIAANPGSAARLFVRKIWYALSGDEVPLNFCFPWYREKSLLLRLLFVGPGFLVPLGGAGLALLLLGSGKVPPRLAAPWVVFAPAYVFAVALFFAATRYRLPLFAPLAIGAGGAAAFVFGARRTAGRRHLAAAAVVAALLAIPALWPTGLWDAAADEEMHLVLYEIEKGDVGAMRHAETAAPAHPDPALFWLRVGTSFAAAGKSDEAITALSRSNQIDPNRPGIASVLSALLEKRGIARFLAGDAAGARPDLEQAVQVDPTNAAACLNLAAVLAEQGETSRARALARQALDLKPDYEKARALLRALDGRK
ncbi:MAG: tetratricopeptide repeat protein [Thermoanaerobaculia bacterium]